MTLKNLKYSMVILFLAVTVVLIHVLIGMAQETRENRAIVQNFAREVSILEKEIADFEKEKQELALLRFKDNILKLKYPALAKISGIVFEKSKKYGFDPFLVMAIIQVESNFDPYAVSTAGAYGLMQVNYSVWKDELDIDFGRIFEKTYNIDLGLKILKHYYDGTGNIFKALFHYNNGYLHNNTEYSGKVISTLFYANRKKAPEDAKKKAKSPI